MAEMSRDEKIELVVRLQTAVAALAFAGRTASEYGADAATIAHIETAVRDLADVRNRLEAQLLKGC